MLIGCGTRSSMVVVDGSSTAYLLTAVAAEDFQAENPGIQVKVGTSGTGGGFDKFCRGETDANDASRQITEEEAAACAAAGISFVPLAVAIDALTVVVDAGNDWADCLTVDQLHAIWEPDSPITNWRQVDPAFPDVDLRLFGPGTDSGTFDTFTTAINGRRGASRTDFTPTEDDNVIVQGVSQTPGALGYFGYTYYQQNADRLRAVAIDGGRGCVTPSAQSAQDGSYQPLSRLLWVYVSALAMRRPAVRSFVTYYVCHDESIASGATFIPLSGQQRQRLRADFARLAAQAAPGDRAVLDAHC